MGASCTDVDECATDADDCISNVVCTNTVGGFTCSCPAGYYGDATATAGATGCTSLNCQESGASGGHALSVVALERTGPENGL